MKIVSLILIICLSLFLAIACGPISQETNQKKSETIENYDMSDLMGSWDLVSVSELSSRSPGAVEHIKEGKLLVDRDRMFFWNRGEMNTASFNYKMDIRDIALNRPMLTGKLNEGDVKIRIVEVTEKKLVAVDESFFFCQFLFERKSSEKPEIDSFVEGLNQED